ncbi:MAG: hypothetical protein M3Y17_16095, partial [Actinomycetota bacterium]|nr:hypothetical protein [Actinomycetota bacterium]
MLTVQAQPAQERYVQPPAGYRIFDPVAARSGRAGSASQPKADDRPDADDRQESMMGKTAGDNLCERLIEWDVDTI